MNLSPSPLPLDQLRGEWLPANTWHCVAAITNPYGCVSMTGNLSGICHTHFHPVYLTNNVPVLELRIDDKPVSCDEMRWSPFELERRAQLGPWRLASAVRIAAETTGVLATLEITNRSAEPAALDASMDVRVPARSFRGQLVGFAPPYGRIADASAHQVWWFEGFAVTQDTLSQAVAAFSAAPKPDELNDTVRRWRRTLAPGETLRLEFAVALAEDFGRCLNVRTWSDSFARAWNACRAGWDARWRDAFTPGNRRYAGHLPAPSETDPRLLRTYYMGVLDLLMNERVHLHPARPRGFVVASPNLGAATQYLWEAGLFASLWARLDEPSARAYLLDLLRVDWRQSYALDYHTGEGLGVWYTVNAWSMWLLAENCLRFAKDGHALLDLAVNGRAVGDHLEEIAWSWRERLDERTGLMHCGDKWNLLECVNGYEHVVPSFNAAAIATSRGVAAVLDRWRGPGAGDALRAAAAAQLPKLLSLYAGDGWWACVREDGERRVVRHIYDLVTIDRCLGDDLPAHIAQDMLAAVRRELISGNWLFAMSPQDPEAVARKAAGEKGRADHAWNGSYSSWVAQTAEMFHRRGAPDEALDILRRAAAVTNQGPFGQGFLADRGAGQERKVMTFTNPCGAAFPQAMIETLWSHLS